MCRDFKKINEKPALSNSLWAGQRTDDLGAVVDASVGARTQTRVRHRMVELNTTAVHILDEFFGDALPSFEM